MTAQIPDEVIVKRRRFWVTAVEGTGMFDPAEYGLTPGAADRPYLNMGFLPAWLYAEVHELTFDAGTLASAVDRSAELAAVRAALGAEGARPRPDEPTSEWI